MKWLVNTVVMSLISVLLGGMVTSIAAQPSGDIFSACAKSNGKVRANTIVVNGVPKCGSSEKIVQWSSGPSLPERYPVTKVTGQIEPGESFSLVSECDSGDHVYTGGWFSSPVALQGSATVELTRNQPAGGGNSPTGWFVQGKNVASNRIRVMVFANCWDISQ